MNSSVITDRGMHVEVSDTGEQMSERCACGCGKADIFHEATAWEGATWCVVLGSLVPASSPERAMLDETDTTAEQCEHCARWTLDKRVVSNSGEQVVLCRDCACGTYPARWKARKAEHWVPRA